LLPCTNALNMAQAEWAQWGLFPPHALAKYFPENPSTLRCLKEVASYRPAFNEDRLSHNRASALALTVRSTQNDRDPASTWAKQGMNVVGRQIMLGVMSHAWKLHVC